MSVVCIAGMHRSGTSLVARLLNLCGLYLGPKAALLAPNEDNMEGYWENSLFVEINDSLLAQLNGTWASPPAVNSGAVLGQPPAFLAKKAERLIRSFDGHNAWGWKDPRNSLTLPFWQQRIPGLKVIVCLRNPLEVAYSLARRDNFPIAMGLELWHTYNQPLLIASAQDTVLTSHYAAYFMNPQDELRRLLEFVGIRVDPRSVESACAAAKLSLRHSRSTLEYLIAEGAPLKVVDLYAQLCSLAGPVYGNGIKNGSAPLVEGDDAETGEIESGLLQRLLDKDPILTSLTAKRGPAMRALTAQVDEKEQLVMVLKTELKQRDALLKDIYASRAWKLMLLIRKVKALSSSRGSLRERVHDFLSGTVGGSDGERRIDVDRPAGNGRNPHQ